LVLCCCCRYLSGNELESLEIPETWGLVELL